MKRLLYLFIAALAITSCEKDLSYEGGVIVQPEPKPEPEPTDTAPKFQLTAFYSDIPIDFDKSDSEVKSETDLWSYVFDYLKDDYFVFSSDTTVEVIQNAIKKPGLNDEILYRSYHLGSDDLGEYIVYLSYDYEETKYRLYEMSEDHFVIGLMWTDGARVFSRFDRVK